MRRIAASSVAPIAELTALPASLRCTRLSRPLAERHSGSASKRTALTTGARRELTRSVDEGRTDSRNDAPLERHREAASTPTNNCLECSRDRDLGCAEVGFHRLGRYATETS